jgi:hypothetical protein
MLMRYGCEIRNAFYNITPQQVEKTYKSDVFLKIISKSLA